VLCHLDDVHAHPGGARHRGEFEADKAGADHHDLAHFAEPLAQNVGIGQGAQRQDPVELGAGHRERAKPRAGGQHDVIAGDLGARAQAQPTTRPIDCGHRLAGNELDLLFLVE
jgi:hypothetical protein